MSPATVADVCLDALVGEAGGGVGDGECGQGLFQAGGEDVGVGGAGDLAVADQARAVAIDEADDGGDASDPESGHRSVAAVEIEEAFLQGIQSAFFGGCNFVQMEEPVFEFASGPGEAAGFSG